jgi:hypoxanthine phosphoribosyltransferase
MYNPMNEINEVLFTREEIAQRVRELGAEITRDYEGKDLIVVGILKGAGVFMCDLIREIREPIRIDFVTVSSYGNAEVSSGIVHVISDLHQDVAGCSVLVVEDIIDSGVTMQCLKRELFARNPESIKVCAAFDKPSRRKVDFKADYTGIEVPDEFIIGYGLDYAGRYRNLPDVCVLELDGGDK